MSAPVINFQIEYVRNISHTAPFPPCFHIAHDIFFHGNFTHLKWILLSLKEPKEMPFTINNIIDNNFIIKPYNAELNSLVNSTYENILTFIFNYLYSLSKDIQNNKLIFLLFILFHEIDIVNLIQNNTYSDISSNLSFYTNELNTDISTQIMYLLICIKCAINSKINKKSIISKLKNEYPDTNDKELNILLTELQNFFNNQKLLTEILEFNNKHSSTGGGYNKKIHSNMKKNIKKTLKIKINKQRKYIRKYIKKSNKK